MLRDFGPYGIHDIYVVRVLISVAMVIILIDFVFIG
jgi:hypothetical protein